MGINFTLLLNMLRYIRFIVRRYSFCYVRLSIVTLVIGVTQLYKVEAQSSILHITDEHLQSRHPFDFISLKGHSLDVDPWKMKWGDSATWALSDFDDTAWQAVMPAYIADPSFIKDSSEFGIRWYRLRFTIDSSLHKKAICFAYSTFGAFEAFIDGEKVLSAGMPANNLKSEILPPFGVLEVRFHNTAVDADTVHTLAIRYSCHYARTLNYSLSSYHSPPIGVRLAITKPESVNTYFSQIRIAIILYGFTAGFPAVIAIFYIVFFVASRERYNLIFAILCLSLTITSTSFILFRFSLGQPYIVSYVSGFIPGIASGITMFTMILLVRHLFTPPAISWFRQPSYIALYLVLAVICDIFKKTSPLVELISTVLWCGATFEIAYATYSALRRRQQGSLVLSIAYGCMIVVAIIADVQRRNIGASDPISAPLSSILFVIYNISLPIAFFILLGLRLIEQNKVLQSYNERLEHRVNERTEELRWTNNQLEEMNAQLVNTNQELDIANEEIHHQLLSLHEQKKAIEDMNEDLQVANEHLTANALIIEEKNIKLDLLNKEKNVFLGIVAHDLKNPLTGILMTAEMIEHAFDKLSKEKIITFANRIRYSADRMKHIIEELLDVNAIESGNFSSSMETIVLRGILDRAHEAIEESAKQKHIIVHLSCKENISVYSDKQRLLQVLDNILSNAIKYSPLHRNVYVRAYHHDSMVHIAVQDEGLGMSEDDMMKLFGRFTKLSAQPTGGEHSSGLGLSIVKQIVESLGGKVWAESDGKDKGTTFYVALPSAQETSQNT